MLKLTKKDQIFLMTLPPVVILVLYVWLWAFPAHSEYSLLKSHVAALGTEEQLILRRNGIAEKLAVEKNILSEREEEMAAEAKDEAIATDRALRLRRFCEVVLSSGGKICTTEPVEEFKEGSSTRLAFSLLQQTGLPQPIVWKIAVEASFPQISRMLYELNRQNLPVIPESLSMKNLDGNLKTKAWTITVCL
jgi:hypothetical protein